MTLSIPVSDLTLAFFSPGLLHREVHAGTPGGPGEDRETEGPHRLAGERGPHNELCSTVTPDLHRTRLHCDSAPIRQHGW